MIVGVLLSIGHVNHAMVASIACLPPLWPGDTPTGADGRSRHRGQRHWRSGAGYRVALNAVAAQGNGERDDDDPKGKGQLSRSARSKSVHATVEIAADKVGIEDVGAHTLRHSAAVGWLESDVRIEAAADLLGHASISIPGDLYGHTSDDAARAAVSGLGDALGL